MAFKNFSQYLEDKMQEPLAGSKPKINKVPDYTGDSPVSPPLEKAPSTEKGIQAGGAKQLKNPAPYKSKTMNGADKGFIYSKTNVPPTEFNTEIQKNKNFGGVPGGEPVDSAFASKGSPGDPFQKTGMTQKTSSQLIGLNTESFVNKTKHLSLAEFTKKLHKDSSKGLDKCGCQKAPHSSIQETVSVCKCNDKYISALVHEMKRNGLLGQLIKEMSLHEETFKKLAALVEQDQSCAFKLSKAINEAVAPPVGMDSSDDQDHSSNMTYSDDEGHDEGEEDHDHEEDHEDHEEGDEDHDHEEDGEDHEDHEEDDEDVPHLDDDGSGDSMSQDEPQSPTPNAHNALQAMRKSMGNW